MMLSDRWRVSALLVAILFWIAVAVSPADAGRAIHADPALREGLQRQYHFAAIPVSPAVLLPVSSVESPPDRVLYRHPESALESAAAPSEPAERKQYHREIRLQIGLGLGVAYVLFLACWFWATRVRPRRR